MQFGLLFFYFQNRLSASFANVHIGVGVDLLQLNSLTVRESVSKCTLTLPFLYYIHLQLTPWLVTADWMALHGINIALVYTGQEKVLLDLYQDFGVDLTNVTQGSDYDFFNGPAFLSWSRGQSMAGVGGKDATTPGYGGALPHWWFDQQAALGVQQANRMRELGITTILRGFEGAFRRLSFPGPRVLVPADVLLLASRQHNSASIHNLVGSCSQTFTRHTLAHAYTHLWWYQ